MPSSVRVGSRPPSNCLIFSNSSGVRPCSRIISGVMATLIAEVVIRESLLSHLHQFFACEFLPGLCRAGAPPAAFDLAVDPDFEIDLESSIVRTAIRLYCRR